MGTACAAPTLVSLGGGSDFSCLLRPLRRLLLFRGQERFLLRFFLLFEFLGHDVRSPECRMFSSDQHQKLYCAVGLLVLRHLDKRVAGRFVPRALQSLHAK